MAQTQEKQIAHPDMTVGEILRRTRIHYEQSIEDIERALHIRAAQIEAIEKGQFNKLPGPVYAAGFIRTYSEYLGLDGDKMVGLFKSQSGSRAAKPELHFPVAASESRVPHTWMVAASLLAVIGIIGLWLGSETNDRKIVNDVPAVPSSIQAESRDVAGREAPAKIADADPAGPPVPAGMAPAPDSAEAPQQAVAIDQSKGIILKIVQNSWVEIKDSSGKAVVSRVLKAGDKYFVPARPDLLMSLGNSGGVQIEIDGQDLSELGARGEVLRNIPLDVVFLKKKFSKNIANPVQ
jgi:cytoskeleton protein RodZ